MSRARKRMDAAIRTRRNLEVLLDYAIRRGDEEDAERLRQRLKHQGKRL